MNRSLLEIAEVLNGQVVTDKSGVVVNGVVTDSRKSTPGTLLLYREKILMVTTLLARLLKQVP